MKLFCSVTLALSLTVSVAMAQQSTGGGSLIGKVLCEDTRGPARHANVFLQPPLDPRTRIITREGGYATTTDLDGSFTISNITPGNYYVNTRYEGYISPDDYVFPGALTPQLTGTLELPPFVQLVTIVSGESKHVEINLKRGGSISGTVTTSDGTPVPYVALTAKVKLSNGDFADLGGASQTDASGDYRIGGLPDASYIVLGGLQGPAVPIVGGGAVGGSGLMIFAGGGMRPTKARVIAVTAPKEYEGVDITIPLAGTHSVSGDVKASDGHRVNDALIRLYPTGEPRFSLATRLSVDGTFSFQRVPPDSYTLRVEEFEDRSLVQRVGAGSVDIDVTDIDLANLSLTVSPTP
jgi:hypothetical protein